MQMNIKEIDFPSLYLDEENARYGNDNVSNQRQAIEKMFSIKNIGPKIVNLAKDIAEHGMDPSELPLVIPYGSSGNAKDKYIVVEGNRRILALMLLHTPSLAPTDTYKKQFETITSAKVKKNLSKIHCSIIKKRNSSDRWVELKHTGQNDGRGRVEWDGLARDTARARRGEKESIGRQIRKYIEADNDFDSSLKSQIDNIDITNLTRLFQSKSVKELLGLVTKNGILESSIPLNLLRPAIEEIIELMLQNGFSVSDIYHDKDRKKFISKVSSNALPDRKQKIDNTWNLANLDIKSLSAAQKNGTSKKKDSNKKKSKTARSKALSSKRNYLIDFKLCIEDKRINEIYNELRKTLNVHDSPNACGVLFRVFLELSSDYYLETNKIIRQDNNKKLTRNDNLKHKFQHICKHLESEGSLTHAQVKSIRSQTLGDENPFCMDLFNGYVHAIETAPISTELNKKMDNWAPYIQAIWK